MQKIKIYTFILIVALMVIITYQWSYDMPAWSTFAAISFDILDRVAEGWILAYLIYLTTDYLPTKRYIKIFRPTESCTVNNLVYNIGMLNNYLHYIFYSKEVMRNEGQFSELPNIDNNLFSKEIKGDIRTDMTCFTLNIGRQSKIMKDFTVSQGIKIFIDLLSHDADSILSASTYFDDELISLVSRVKMMSLRSLVVLISNDIIAVKMLKDALPEAIEVNSIYIDLLNYCKKTKLEVGSYF